jgi:hypothetical protein
MVLLVLSVGPTCQGGPQGMGPTTFLFLSSSCEPPPRADASRVVGRRRLDPPPCVLPMSQSSFPARSDCTNPPPSSVLPCHSSYSLHVSTALNSDSSSSLSNRHCRCTCRRCTNAAASSARGSRTRRPAPMESQQLRILDTVQMSPPVPAQHVVALLPLCGLDANRNVLYVTFRTLRFFSPPPLSVDPSTVLPRAFAVGLIGPWAI